MACARATLTRALSLLPLPSCLRDRSRCARLSFFSARRRNLGAAILVPSSSTAKWVRPRSIPHSASVSGSGLSASLDDERREVPARRVRITVTERVGGQAAGPADLDIADLRQAQPPVAQHPNRELAVNLTDCLRSLRDRNRGGATFGPFRFPFTDAKKFR